MQHTFGPTCQLDLQRVAARSASAHTSPPVRAQFFYHSVLPIDDPLSPLPPPSNASDSVAVKHPQRPFAAHDNAALEEAWQGLSRETSQPDALGDPTKDNEGIGGVSVESDMIFSRWQRDTARLSDTIGELNESPAQEMNTTPLRNALSSHHAETRSARSLDGSSEVKKSPRTKKQGALYINKTKNKDEAQADKTPASSYPSYGSSLSEKHMTGTPFLRAPSRSRRPFTPSDTGDGAAEVSRGEEINHRSSPLAGSPGGQSNLGRYDSPRRTSRPISQQSSSEKPTAKNNYSISQVPVGISRLHVVEFPSLEMKPIYWSPVNDISTVSRGTWFYKDSMLPVEAEVANQLEHGYLALKPWTETWNDELNSAVAVGAEGEAKIVHRLWPKYEPNKIEDGSRPGTAQGGYMKRSSAKSGDTNDTSARSQDLEGLSSENRSLAHVAAEAHTTSAKAKGRRYASSSVIYLNSREAFILRSNLLPSAYYGRRPLSKIRKGVVVGIPVVRGFDWSAWHKLHPSKKTDITAQAQEGAAASQSGTANSERRKVCRACAAVREPQKVTDLILVIHGIGQKLSERVESFNFTHSVNSFRRQIHIELASPAVKGVLRPGIGGIMALPVNWRSTLSLEDEGPARTGNAASDNEFSLKEITPGTLPAVRNLVSDVMLDIPYYLSHYKSKMIEAVTREANRIYRLWCKNNPGFEHSGRVHLIAHSLGSVMALDILSKQPTALPLERDLSSAEINSQFLDFDTKNLFFCGSPAGFFLLLNKASLLPRAGRNKPGTENDVIGKGVAAEVDTYGCLAIDNIYNILNYYDPIAYKLNSTVDKDYAAALKPAFIPSASTSFFSSLGNAFKSFTPGGTSSTDGLQKPSIARLPSTIELETHDFTREEIAEERMYLLNENGQIDYYLNAGGGPLEIQYINMLSAHSSYWVSRDFVRFLVLEIGRRPGRDWTLGNLRAAKRAFVRK